MTEPALDILVPSGYARQLVAQQKAFRGQEYATEATFTDGVPQPADFTDLTTAYNVHVWVYAACWAIASNYAMLDYKAFRHTAAGDYEEEPDFEFLKLMAAPNPFMSGYSLREFTALSLELTGNAFWALEYGDGPDQLPTELWPVPAGNMQPVASKTEMIDHYLYKINGQTVRYEFDEILHFRYMNPSSFLFGQGSLDAVKQSVMTDIYAALWNKSFFKNAARPDSVFETDQVLGDDVRARVLKGWQSMHRGVDRHGKTALLEGGMKLRETTWKHADMEFTELRKLSREEILASFGVPPIMCGILEYANYANAKEQTAIFWKHTILPKVRAIQDMLTMRVRQLTLEPDISIESDTSNVEALRIDENQRAETAKLYWQMGVPLNALIDKFDLPFDPVEGGDESKPQTSGGFGLAASLDGPQGAPKPKHKAQPAGFKPDKAVIDAEWKAFDAKITPIEERFTAAMKVFFRAQRRRVSATFLARAPAFLSAHGVSKDLSGNKPLIDVGVFFDSERERKKMQDAVHQFISGTYVDFAVAAGKKIDPVFKFNMQDPLVLDWLHSKELKLVQEVTDYTMESLNEAIVAGIKEAVEEGIGQGDTIKELSARIDDVYQLANDNRSELIARTETLSASNAGSLEGMSQAGAEGKMWLAAQPTKYSRDWHLEMDGQEAPIDDDFILSDGSHMNAPGDPSAGPENICNCRCTIRSVRTLEKSAPVTQARVVVNPRIHVTVPKVRKENVELVRDEKGKIVGSSKLNIYDGEE